MRNGSASERSGGFSSPRILVVTNMYPTGEQPAFGTFVKRQMDALTLSGCEQRLLLIEGWRSRLNYVRAIFRVRKDVYAGRYDLVHAYYGLCGFVATCQGRVPVVVTYCGDRKSVV